MAQNEWSNQLRVIAGVGGAALTLYAFSRMALVRIALVGAGAVLLARSVTNIEFGRLLDLGARRLAGLGSGMDRGQSGSRPRRAQREEQA